MGKVRKKVEKKGKMKEIALNMLKEGLNILLISKITGLSEDKILILRGHVQ